MDNVYRRDHEMPYIADDAVTSQDVYKRQLYKIMTMLGVINTSWAVTLPSIFGASCPGLAGAFGVFMMRQFFMGVPKELNEAAAIDGAGPIRTFISIMLPMAKSTLASLAIIVFTYSWNDYFTTFIMINDTEKLTLPVGILSIKQPFSTGDNVVSVSYTHLQRELWRL